MPEAGVRCAAQYRRARVDGCSAPRERLVALGDLREKLLRLLFGSGQGGENGFTRRGRVDVSP